MTRATDVMAPEPLFEICLRRTKARRIVTALERQINRPLLRLLGLPARRGLPRTSEPPAAIATNPRTIHHRLAERVVHNDPGTAIVEAP